MGNEAIVRGALEADIRFVASYPGTPSSEIASGFAKIHKEEGIYFEYSSNEKVAAEVAAGAALSGLRTMAVMKHVGVNVASDALMSLAYVGTKAGYVLISADDPSCHSSQNEQDNRLYARFMNIPMLEPSTAQEAKDMTAYAFELSETVELPVMLRTTTGINHLRGVVDQGEIQKRDQKTEFLKDPRYIERKQAHSRLLVRMDKALELSEESPWNRLDNPNQTENPETGFISSGVAWNFVDDLVKENQLPATIFKAGLSHPLPEKKLKDYLRSLRRIIIVEELEPCIEDHIYRLAKEVNPKLEIIGKYSGHFPRVKEYHPDLIKKVASEFFAEVEPAEKRDVTELPPRYPSMCPGCSHRNTYFAVKQVFGENAIYPNDIGCYALGIAPPINMGDIWLCMSGGAGLAGGFGFANDEPVVAFIGDGTFLHSGLHPLLNAVNNRHNFILVIMDNSITAMTGHQPNPGSESVDDVRPSEHVDIETVVRALGVKQVATVNPREIKPTVKVIREMKEQKGIRVLIARQPCVINLYKRNKEIQKSSVVTVDTEKCNHCGICINDYCCPAFEINDLHEINVIDSLCIGCGDCIQVCPTGAISKPGGAS